RHDPTEDREGAQCQPELGRARGVPEEPEQLWAARVRAQEVGATPEARPVERQPPVAAPAADRPRRAAQPVAVAAALLLHADVRDPLSGGHLPCAADSACEPGRPGA